MFAPAAKKFSRHPVIDLGEKAETLLLNEARLDALGCKIPLTFALSLASFTAVPAHKRDFLGDYLPTALTDRTIGRIGARLNSRPFLAVRSSAHGDAGGTGVYTSRIVRSGSAAELESAVFQVLLSHASPEAKNFRREQGLPDEMGVFIQPAIGSIFLNESGFSLFGPALNFIVNTQSEVPIQLAFGFGDPTSFEAANSRSTMAFTLNRFGKLALERPISDVTMIGNLLPMASPGRNCVDIRTLRQGLSPEETGFGRGGAGSNFLNTVYGPKSSSSRFQSYSFDPKIIEGLVGSDSPVLKKLLFIVDELGKQFPHENVYLEGAIPGSGEIFVTQFAVRKLRHTCHSGVSPIPDEEKRTASHPIEAVSLHKAPLVSFSAGSEASAASLRAAFSDIDARFCPAPRSLVLMLPYSSLQACFETPRILWGELLSVGAIVCVDEEFRSRPIECHFNGSIRTAHNLGFCVLPRDQVEISFRNEQRVNKDVTYSPAAVSVHIEEGDSAIVGFTGKPAKRADGDIRGVSRNHPRYFRLLDVICFLDGISCELRQKAISRELPRDLTDDLLNVSYAIPTKSSLLEKVAAEGGGKDLFPYNLDLCAFDPEIEKILGTANVLASLGRVLRVSGQLDLSYECLELLSSLYRTQQHKKA